MEYGCELIRSICDTLEGNLVKENIFFYIPAGKTFIYISTLHFYILLANYKYLAEWKGDFSL